MKVSRVKTKATMEYLVTSHKRYLRYFFHLFKNPDTDLKRGPSVSTFTMHLTSIIGIVIVLTFLEILPTTTCRCTQLRNRYLFHYF